MFENIIVQSKIKEFFTKVIENNKLAHAYIFYGNRGCGKAAFAFELAKVLNCTDPSEKPCGTCPSCIKIQHAGHPDIKFIFPLSKSLSDEKRLQTIKGKTRNPYQKMNISGHLNIPIESIRDLKKEAMYAPFEAKKRVFIISGIEYFSREAANSFLKLLEEPPDNLLLILIANDYNSVLSTIRSRCQPLLFPMLTDEQVQKIIEPYNEGKSNLTTLIRINQNNIEKIIDLLQQNSQDIRLFVVDYLRGAASGNWHEVNKVTDQLVQMRDKNKVLEFIDLLIIWLSDSFRYSILNDAQQLSNADMQETIIKFANHYEQVNYSYLIEKLEKVYREINMNAHIALSLYDMAIEFKRVLNFKKGA